MAVVVFPERHRQGQEAGGLGSVGFEEIVGVSEAGGVVDGVGVEDGGFLGDGLEPFGVFFKEDDGAAGIEGGPHEGVAAKAEDEEVVGGAMVEDVVGDANLGEGLLGDDTGGGIVVEHLREIRLQEGGGGGGKRAEEGTVACVAEAGDEEGSVACAAEAGDEEGARYLSQIVAT